MSEPELEKILRDFAAGVIWMGYWAAGWGCGGDRVNFIIDPTTNAGSIGAELVGFWTGCVKLLAVGYLFSYFWTASTAVYFLLRRDVDHTEMDEVFLDADESEQDYGLPTLKTDEARTLSWLRMSSPPAAPRWIRRP